MCSSAESPAMMHCRSSSPPSQSQCESHGSCSNQTWVQPGLQRGFCEAGGGRAEGGGCKMRLLCLVMLPVLSSTFEWIDTSCRDLSFLRTLNCNEVQNAIVVFQGDGVHCTGQQKPEIFDCMRNLTLHGGMDYMDSLMQTRSGVMTEWTRPTAESTFEP
eukprot:s2183_g7.t1